MAANGFQNFSYPMDDPYTQTTMITNAIVAGQNMTNQQLAGINTQLSYLCTQAGNDHALKEQEKYRAEEAYSQIIENPDGLITFDKSGYPHRVIGETRLEYAFRIRADARYCQPDVYVIQFVNARPLVIAEKEFQKPELLVNQLSSAVGKPVARLRSTRKIGQLLQNFFSAAAKELYVPFYSGWKQIGDRWDFCLFGSSTHGQIPLKLPVTEQLPNFLEKPVPLLAVSEVLHAVERICALMDSLTSKTLQSVVFLFVHVSLIYSLLDGLGFRPRVGLCIYSPEPRVLACLDKLFNWYGDSNIAMSLPSKKFLDRLTERKDQPLVIQDSSQNEGNVGILLNAMETNSIPLAERSGTEQSLQALPTVLSGKLSALSFSPQFVLLEALGKDLQDNAFARISMLVKYLPDYLHAFAHYVSDHVHELEQEISTAMSNIYAACPEDIALTEDALSMLGILMGVQNTVRAFHNDLLPSDDLAERLRSLLPPNLPNELMRLMQQSSTYADSDSAIASQFSAVVLENIQLEKFDVRDVLNGSQLNSAGKCELGTVYQDEDFYYFTRQAFTSVCHMCKSSSPVVLHALSAQGILSGTPVNGSTFLTRKTIVDQEGQRSVKALYKIEQAALEEYACF